jgi:LysM repeat protein
MMNPFFKQSLFVFSLFLAGDAVLYAQPSERKFSPKEYVELHKDDAVKEMKQYGVPASITLAQGMLESDNGNSDLAVYANNHFGIKCHEDWSGPSFVKDDDTKDECFRKYRTVLESYSDHSHFLRTRQRYAFLFDLKTTDYHGWAKGLKESGYATEPKYKEMLLEIIEKNKLFLYDKDSVIATPMAVSVLAQRPPERPKDNAIRKQQMTSERNWIFARPGDTFESLAQEFQKGAWELPKYNDLDRHTKLAVGQRIYLNPKRRKGAVDYHVVKAGDTMYSVSQQYCIKLKFLYRKNNMKPGMEPKAGDVLFLRKSKKKG